jgi:hypothetical protein
VNCTTLNERIHRALPGDYTTEDRIVAVEVRLWRKRQEELRTASIRSGESHTDGAAHISRSVQLITNGEARTAAAVTTRVAPLRHERRDDAMETQTVEVAGASERAEVVCGHRRLYPIQHDPDRTTIRCEDEPR